MSNEKFKKTLEYYDKAIDKCPEFDRKGKNLVYTSANGYMFSQMNKAGELGIRLSKESQKNFIEKHNSGPFMSYGATMRDYVLVPDDLLHDLGQMATYLQESYAFVMTLEPK